MDTVLNFRKMTARMYKVKEEASENYMTSKPIDKEMANETCIDENCKKNLSKGVE